MTLHRSTYRAVEPLGGSRIGGLRLSPSTDRSREPSRPCQPCDHHPPIHPNRVPPSSSQPTQPTHSPNQPSQPSQPTPGPEMPVSSTHLYRHTAPNSNRHQTSAKPKPLLPTFLSIRHRHTHHGFPPRRRLREATRRQHLHSQYRRVDHPKRHMVPPRPICRR